MRTIILLVLAGVASADIVARPLSDDTLRVSWAAPPNDGGQPVTKYKVEWDSTPGAMEQQQVAIEGATSGSFALWFRNERTADLQYDAPAGTVQDALEVLQRLHETRPPGGSTGDANRDEL